ncbi:hypothetical protein D1872_173340 [compost metagenome]
MLKRFFGKKAMTGTMLTLSLMMIASSAFAAGDDVTGAVTSAFDGLKTIALAILAAVGGIAILLFAGIYGWKYGKKVFSIIAK